MQPELVQPLGGRLLPKWLPITCLRKPDSRKRSLRLRAVSALKLYDQATLALETYEAELSRQALSADPDATQSEIKRQFRSDEKWNILKNDQLEKQRKHKIVEKAAKAFEMKSNNMANINRRQIAQVNRQMAQFDD